MKKLVLSVIAGIFPILLLFVIFTGCPDLGHAGEYVVGYIEHVYNVKDADITVKRTYGAYTATCGAKDLEFTLYRRLVISPWGVETDCDIKEQLDKKCYMEIDADGKSEDDLLQAANQKLMELRDLYETYNIWSFNPKVKMTIIKGDKKTDLTYAKYTDPEEWKNMLKE